MPEKTLEKLTRDLVKTLPEGSTLSMLGIRDLERQLSAQLEGTVA